MSESEGSAEGDVFITFSSTEHQVNISKYKHQQYDNVVIVDSILRSNPGLPYRLCIIQYFIVVASAVYRQSVDLSPPSFYVD